MVGQTETRREASLEYRKFEHAFFRGGALQLRSVDGARVRAMVISIEMGKVMAMTVPVTAMPSQIAPCGDCKPATKGNECEARDRVNDVAEVSYRVGEKNPNLATITSA